MLGFNERRQNEAPLPEGGASRKGNFAHIVPLDPPKRRGLRGTFRPERALPFSHISPVGLDDHFDGIFCRSHQLKSKTCLGQRKPMGNHLAKRKALTSYPFNGSRDIKGASPVGRQKGDSVIPKIKEGENKIDTRL